MFTIININNCRKAFYKNIICGMKYLSGNLPSYLMQVNKYVPHDAFIYCVNINSFTCIGALCFKKLVMYRFLREVAGLCLTGARDKVLIIHLQP